MDKDRDLLPWILGGLSVASVALAVAMAATNQTSPSLASATSQPAAHALPAVALAPAAAVPAPAVEPALVTEPAQISAATPVMQSTGQIWACTMNGQKIFSNNPCGAKSSLVDLGPINTMDRAPLYRSASTYPPGPVYAPDYSYPDSQDSADNGYPTMVAVPIYVRGNLPRAHRPFNHGHSPAPRKY